MRGLSSPSNNKVIILGRADIIMCCIYPPLFSLSLSLSLPLFLAKELKTVCKVTTLYKTHRSTMYTQDHNARHTCFHSRCYGIASVHRYVASQNPFCCSPRFLRPLHSKAGAQLANKTKSPSTSTGQRETIVIHRALLKLSAGRRVDGQVGEPAGGGGLLS